MKRILVIGHRGMLGHDLVSVLGKKFAVEEGLDQVDVCNADSLRRCMNGHRPDVVVNAAAYTDVDGAESDSERVFEVNALGAKNVALAAKETGAKSVYYSTDYVFNGAKDKPYVEEDEPNPLGVYSRSKWEGESAVLEVDPGVLVIRTAWLYGAGGKNFVNTMIKLSEEKDELHVVNDQRGSPTWTVHLAQATINLVEANARGLVHVTSSGDVTWCGFAKKIFEKLNRPVRVVPITTAEFGSVAPRPAYSVLDTSKYRRITGETMPHWEEALDAYLAERTARPG